MNTIEEREKEASNIKKQIRGLSIKLRCARGNMSRAYPKTQFDDHREYLRLGDLVGQFESELKEAEEALEKLRNCS